MEDLFARIVLGHLVADYLLQPMEMAIHKTDRTWYGFNCCLVHCLIYTAVVCLFLWTMNPLIAGLVFLSHFPIDRYSLATFWLKMIGGRDILTEFKSTIAENPYREIGLPFSCFVYAVADNTMHLVLLWWITRLMTGGMI